MGTRNFRARSPTGKAKDPRQSHEYASEHAGWDGSPETGNHAWADHRDDEQAGGDQYEERCLGA